MTIYKSVEELEKATIIKITRAVRVGAITTFQNIIIGSPVDTGRFRSNWQCSINTPITTVLDQEIRKDAHGKPVKNQFTNTTDVAEKTNDYTLDGAMFLTNLPYAQRLANGWSQQRSSGWIDVEVANGKKAVADAIKSFK
jgi:hypothetical protein